MIITGKSTGIDPATGFYNYELRPDAKISEVADYRNMENYLFYVGTSVAPWTGRIQDLGALQRIDSQCERKLLIDAKF